MSQIYDWIDIAAVQDIENKALLAFGAGKGTEQFMDYLKKNQIPSGILAITDNNPSLHGKALNDIEIIPPEAIEQTPFDKIVVTSISGRDFISKQLCDMGYDYPTDFILIGRYPETPLKNVTPLLSAANDTGFSIKGKTCLNIGAGGFLGFEVLLYCMGAEKIFSIDKHSFGIQYPDITPQRTSYLALRDAIQKLPLGVADGATAMDRYQQIFIRKSKRLSFDPEKIVYLHPMDAGYLLFDNNQFDVVLSFAVLEHVHHPHKVISEIARVLKPHGACIHTIKTRDHRSFSNVDGFNPFSFRYHSAGEWDKISSQSFYQNRLLPVEWKRLHMDNGFSIATYTVGENIDIQPDVMDRFNPEFHCFSKKELSEIDCTIHAIKQI